MNEIVKEWIQKAEGDFKTAKREIKVTENPNYDAVCFHAQQCIEKLIKAAHIQHNIIPPKTHDLIYLYNQFEQICKDCKLEIEDLRFLTRAAVDFRYPGDFADREEAEEAMAICERLRTELEKVLRKT